jgi:hypothetical protein
MAGHGLAARRAASRTRVSRFESGQQGRTAGYLESRAASSIWQSNGFLTRRFGVQIPGGALRGRDGNG